MLSLLGIYKLHKKEFTFVNSSMSRKQNVF